MCYVATNLNSDRRVKNANRMRGSKSILSLPKYPTYAYKKWTANPRGLTDMFLIIYKTNNSSNITL
jgi:hypothetical protein